MLLPRVVSVLIASLVAGSACSTSYDFRDGHRPVYQQTVSTEEFEALRRKGLTVLDVRLREDFDADPVLIPQARYKDPEKITQWVVDMTPADGPVAVYCVRGKWVSQKAANYLKDRGFEVYTLDGGIEAWKKEGRPTTPAQE